MLLSERVMPIGIAAFIGIASVGFIGEAIGGRVVYGLAFLFVVALMLLDWWRLRNSAETPRAVADRLARYAVFFALVLALPGLETLVALVGE